MIRILTFRMYALAVVALFAVALNISLASVAHAQQMFVGHASASLPMGPDSSSRVPTAEQSERILGVVGLNPRDPVFLPAVTYGWDGTVVGSLVVADVNGDRKPDLVAANRLSGAIAVLLGRGDGTFGTVKTYESGNSSAGALTVTDVNGDGKPDLIAASPDEGTVSVLLGNGDGTFQAAVKFAVGYGPGALTVTDVNSDGKPDLIVTVGYLVSVSVLMGNGDGTFQAVMNYPLGGYRAEVLTVTDVNADGKPDLIVGVDTLSEGTVAILLGNGDGTFQAAVNHDSGGTGPLFLTLKDVDADGKLDILVANHDGLPNCPGEGILGVMLGNGDGSFQPTATYCAGGWVALSIAVEDLNSDGKQDLIVLTGDNVGVLLGKGDGTFLTAQTYISGFETYSMVVADVSGDGNYDLVGAACGEQAVSVSRGRGDGTFVPAVRHNTGGYCPTSIVLGDLNGDHYPDAVVANESTGTLAVLLNSTLSPPTTNTLVSSLNPANPKKNVTYTATVAKQGGGALTGAVTFQDGTTDLARVTLAANQAAFTTQYKTTGVHPITATYWGNAENAGSASATLIEYVQRNTKTVVTTSGSPSRFGQPVTFTATVTSVTAAIPDGELVTFFDGTTPLASVALAGGTASFTSSSLSAGKHIIKATYAGDVTFKPSTGKVTQVVTKYPTTTVLISIPNPSAHGQPVIFTATVTPTGPYPLTGSVKFWDGTAAMGTATLNGGTAKITKATLVVGSHPITAQYLGDATSDKSTSSVVKQVVQ